MPTFLAHAVTHSLPQVYAFELLHYQRATTVDRSISVVLTCPGIPGSAFPINIEDPSPRRRQSAFEPWPRWPGHASSPAVSRALQLVAGQRYWLHLQCSMGERDFATCGVGARVGSTKTPTGASLGSTRWQARVHRGITDTSARCEQITDKAECCGAVDREGDICVAALTTFADGGVCAGWNTRLKDLPAQGNALATCPPHENLQSHSARPRVALISGTSCSDITDKAACCSAVDSNTGAPCVPAATVYTSGAVCESAQALQPTTFWAEPSCSDTPDWNTGTSSMDCAAFVGNGWCADGAFADDSAPSGANYKYPEANCCACGKGNAPPYRDPTAFGLRRCSSSASPSPHPSP